MGKLKISSAGTAHVIGSKAMTLLVNYHCHCYETARLPCRFVSHPFHPFSNDRNHFTQKAFPTGTEPDDGDATRKTKGRLSSRMLIPGNTWQSVWESARPVPARRQVTHSFSNLFVCLTAHTSKAIAWINFNVLFSTNRNGYSMIPEKPKRYCISWSLVRLDKLYSSHYHH